MPQRYRDGFEDYWRIYYPRFPDDEDYVAGWRRAEALDCEAERLGG